MAPQLAFLSDWHIIVLALLVVLLFGGKKLPEVARGLGEAMREFKKASRDLHEDPHDPHDTASRPAPSAPVQQTTPAPQHNSEPKQG
jgi:sec-independent protein translocase protein TatA